MTDRSKHKLRRTFSVISGVIAVIFITLGVVAQSLLGLVGSADGVRNTVTSNISKPVVRDLIAEKVVEKIEEESDLTKDPITGIIFAVARTVIVNSVSQKLTEPIVVEFVGDVAAKMYTVYVDDEPIAPIDMSLFADSARQAIVAVDKKLGAEFKPTFDPLEITRDDGFNLGALRDLAKNTALLLLIGGILLLGLMWWLQVTGTKEKIRRIGIFVSTVGALGVVVTVLARNIIPNFSEEQTEAVAVGVDIVTAPLLTRSFVILILGVIAAGIGEVLCRKDMNVSDTA